MTITYENPFKMKARAAAGRAEIRRWSPGDRIKLEYSAHGMVGAIKGHVVGTVVTDREDWISLIDNRGVRSDFHPVQITSTEEAS